MMNLILLLGLIFPILKNDMKLEINSKKFDVHLEENMTAKSFVDKLPIKVNMKDLNGNEKYYYLDFSLKTKPVKVNQINAGDIMLFGDNCIVIFYKSFNSSYSYTKIGSIINPQNLEESLGRTDVTVSFKYD